MIENTPLSWQGAEPDFKPRLLRVQRFSPIFYSKIFIVLHLNL